MENIYRLPVELVQDPEPDPGCGGLSGNDYVAALEVVENLAFPIAVLALQLEGILSGHANDLEKQAFRARIMGLRQTAVSGTRELRARLGRNAMNINGARRAA